MINNETLEKIKNYPVNERIEIIAEILESLKSDIQDKRKGKKSFKVKKIRLGQDVNIDRNKLYLERGL
ncbi:hypothetical protein GF406_20625 [candidate division KSB1 bacterium]|nr:hypothetical protein [candidate division KSB1 bacterium]